MYKIGVISDTHGLLRPEVLKALQGCDAVLHGGDFDNMEIYRALEGIAPFYAVLGNNDVNIVALSLADTSDYGMLRMIVSDPNKGRAVLKDNGITAMLTDVVALRVPHETGSLSKAMHQIVEGEVNVEYM